ncbi:chromate transporter [Hujiaoplasma nucleasis]|uniref:Chromate transporter n=1 Tax=Hujiaoplasma nucleasis TaxID=2725268 RepID=A0A7L6N3L9_9MOLU|nr:chromate transporter [Hujiaoplasma nucleasis]QLY39655.1 chromate transporter [Hujiaoplasma nucleasis]
MEIFLKLLELLFTFFKIGLFTFGGGYAMIPLITEEVISKGWETHQTLIDFIAIAESTPGPFAINIATFIGYEQLFIIGAVFTTLGVILPSFIIIVIIAKIFKHFADNKYVVGFLNGAKPVIVGVIFSVGVNFILLNVFSTKKVTLIKDFVFDWKTVTILVSIFLLSKIKDRIHPVVIVLASGVMGYILFGIL